MTNTNNTNNVIQGNSPEIIKVESIEAHIVALKGSANSMLSAAALASLDDKISTINAAQPATSQLNAASTATSLELYVGNKENHLLRYFEPEPGIFIAESCNVIELALNSGYEPISAIILDRILGNPILDRLADQPKLPIYLVDADDAKACFGYILPGGICCAMRRKASPDYQQIIENAHRIVVLDDVENPTNVGAIFRSAAAFGIDALLLSPACADPLYRRALRVSVGNAFLIPWAFMCQSEAEWESQGISLLQAAGFKTVALALREDNINIDDDCLKSEDKLALIMGNEGYGLKTEVINACDYVAKIPMQNNVDSLNVAVAAGLAMWEIRK